MQSLKKWEQLVEVLDSDDVLLGQSWRRRNCRRRRDWAEVVLSVPCQFTRIGSSGFALHEPKRVDGESCAKSVPRCKIILSLLQSASRTVLAASPFCFRQAQRRSPLLVPARTRSGTKPVFHFSSQRRSGKSIESGRQFVNQTLFKECEDCEPRIKRIKRIGSEEISRF